MNSEKSIKERKRIIDVGRGVEVVQGVLERCEESKVQTNSK